MSMISEQVKTLKKVCMDYPDYNTRRLILDAADTIEDLSAKLQSANTERSTGDCDKWILCSSGKMPHGGSAVLIQLRRNTDGITADSGYTVDISFVRTSKNEWVSSCGTYPFEDVVAWMPINTYKLKQEKSDD